MVSTRKSCNKNSLQNIKINLFKQDEKPILRSFNTIDEDENPYNNINFNIKKRNYWEIDEHDDDDDEQDDDDNDANDDELFNSSDDEYYSALSDADDVTDLKNNSSKRLKYSSSNKHNESIKAKIPTEEIDLVSIEESFKKIINENKSNINFKTTIEVLPESENILSSKVSATTNSTTNPTTLTFDEYLNYTDDEEDSLNSSSSSSESDSDNSNLNNIKKIKKLLPYRTDEKHNLAFPDISTFPTRFDPSIHQNKVVKRKRTLGLNRRAIQSGQASEMVGTGINSTDDFFL